MLTPQDAPEFYHNRFSLFDHSLKLYVTDTTGGVQLKGRLTDFSQRLRSTQMTSYIRVPTYSDGRFWRCLVAQVPILRHLYNALSDSEIYTWQILRDVPRGSVVAELRSWRLSGQHVRACELSV